MSTTSKLALVAAVVVAGLSSPAFAAYPGDFANVLPYTAASAPYPVAQTHAVSRSAREAFAFAPAQANGGFTSADQAAHDAIVNH